MKNICFFFAIITFLTADITNKIVEQSSSPSYKVIYINGKAWLDKNLGALNVAKSSNDISSFGDLYQWGRGKDGHEKRNSATTTKCSTDDTPSHVNFIKGTKEIGGYNWRTINTDCKTDAKRTKLWNLETNINFVCPKGWRIPSEEDFKQLDIINSDDAFRKLKLPLSGYRDCLTANVCHINFHGYYWTNTVSSENSRNLYITKSGASYNSHNRGYGFSIRCIKR